MVKHIVLWSFQEQLTDGQKKEAGEKMKAVLEPLKEKIPGVISLKVIPGGLKGSNKDIMLYGEYESEEALQNYAVHPLHLEAGAYVKSVTCGRTCFDYEE